MVTRNKNSQDLPVPELRGLESSKLYILRFLPVGLYCSVSLETVPSRLLQPFFSTSSALEPAQLFLPGTETILTCFFLLKPLSSGKPSKSSLCRLFPLLQFSVADHRQFLNV